MKRISRKQSRNKGHSKPTKEQKNFISILKDYLSENNSAIFDSLDWHRIKKYADHHQVSAIVYKQTKQKIFQEAYASQLYRYANFEQAIKAFKEALKPYDFVMVKGIVVAELYPVPELRSMGDVDVLIHTKDLENIHRTLSDAGFTLQKGSPLGEWVYSKNGFLFEVHDTLVHRYEGKENLVEYFSHVWDYIEDGRLSWSFHLIYLLEHLRQHFVGSGVGFRQFMDVAVVCKKCDIDGNFVAEELKKIKLYNFATTVFAFIERWFGIGVPFETAEISEEFYARATCKILEDGVFGFNNEENRETKVSFQMHYKGLDYKTAKKQYLIRKFFPKYKSMCNLPYCSYVKKSILLLPVAWIHRIVYRAFNKQSRKNMKAQLSQKKVEARMNMLKEWGL